ncbi:hypothetical protein AEAC466_19570 [Asticcacaulis sp. AC466]|uniref:LPS export ABC transporter periplasmic protein LptC n=1 Tax=Asticcacaulis sp. AC466 TaxID=1282362 RepID=UPI0003C3E631|nr:LPS export ABC transporter periplasmic protein LptC [Asticcacaulis sp. AC466]ESQ81931.1 hypothetical protein AEAC466_19570 [Asticcacaulis sp. AC466]
MSDIHAPLEPLGVATRMDAATEAAERRVRLSQQVAAVRRRSRLIKSLRKLFPAAMIGLGVLNLGWIAVQTVLNSMNLYGGNSNEIRMTNPRYYGQGDNGDHYTISGLELIRKGNNATTVTLRAPNIEFKGADTDNPTRVTAANGVYDQNTNRMTLTGNVVLQAGESDFVLKTEEAVADLANSTIYGNKHVDGTSSVGHIEGESFIISDNGKQLTMRGKGPIQVHAKENPVQK